MLKARDVACENDEDSVSAALDVDNEESDNPQTTTGSSSTLDSEARVEREDDTSQQPLPASASVPETPPPSARTATVTLGDGSYHEIPGGIARYPANDIPRTPKNVADPEWVKLTTIRGERRTSFTASVMGDGYVQTPRQGAVAIVLETPFGPSEFSLNIEKTPERYLGQSHIC